MVMGAAGFMLTLGFAWKQSMIGVPEFCGLGQ